MTTFTTSLDKFNKITTIIVSIIVIGIGISSFFLSPENGQDIMKITAIPIVLVCIITYLFRPNDYSVSSDKLLIHRILGNVEINRTNIQSVQEIDESLVKNSLRTFGVGGFFGSFGKFWNGKLGNMTWYVTRGNNFVLIETKDHKKIILTPDKPEAFVASLQ